MRRTHVTIYPWDVLDEPADAVLDRIQGEAGATGVTLWVACPEVTLCRAREVEPRVVRAEGGLLFSPNAEHFTATRVKPTVPNRWRTHDAPAAMAERCATRGLELRLMISASQMGRLAEKHPEAAAKNAFGDVSRKNLCLNHPDVREFLRGLVSDMATRFPAAGLVLTDVLSAWAEAFDNQCAYPVPLGDIDRLLLSICFCESCKQGATAAGLDAPAVERCVKVLISQRFEGKSHRTASISDLMEEHAPLRAYIRWRSHEIGGLLECLARSHGGEFIWDRSLNRVFAEAEPSVAPENTTLSTLVESMSEFEQTMTHARGQEIRFGSTLTTTVDGAALVGAASLAAERGVAGLTFDTWSLWPDSTLDSIRQAIRIARRAGA